jgi:flavodoxin I
MKKIALIYDSETGNTERMAYLIKLYLTDYEVDIIKVETVLISQFSEYQYFIFGTPTWRKGYLAVNWAGFFNDFSKINFSGKTVGLFGLGDQENYSRTFLDGMGQLAEILVRNSANIVGTWSINSYYFDYSLADSGKGYFMGLGLDETNQSELTEQRIIDWTKQISIEFTNHHDVCYH